MSINPQIIVVSFGIATAIGTLLAALIIIEQTYIEVSKWLKNYRHTEMLWSRMKEFFVCRISFVIMFKNGRFHVIAKLPLLLSCTVIDYGTEDRAIETARELRIAVDSWLSTHCKPRIVWWEVV